MLTVGHIAIVPRPPEPVPGADASGTAWHAIAKLVDGAAAIGFVMGTRVKGEMIGSYPGLGRLDEDDNERSTADFRGIYCSLIEQWFDQDASRVIPGAARFQRPAIIA